MGQSDLEHAFGVEGIEAGEVGFHMREEMQQEETRLRSQRVKAQATEIRGVGRRKAVLVVRRGGRGCPRRGIRHFQKRGIPLTYTPQFSRDGFQSTPKIHYSNVGQWPENAYA